MHNFQIKEKKKLSRKKIEEKTPSHIYRRHVKIIFFINRIEFLYYFHLNKQTKSTYTRKTYFT